MSFNKIRVGITQGDVNGIGYEVIMKSLEDSRMLEVCTPIIYGSAKIAAYHKKTLENSTFSFLQITDAAEANPKRINLINVGSDNVKVELGKKSVDAGDAAFKSIEKAAEDLKEGKLDVIVTAPINKDMISSEQFKFPGHTEYFASKFGSEEENGLMFMVTDTLKIGVVTGHIPFEDVPKAVTKEAILEKLRIIKKTLIEDFAKTNPRIAVLGLNPHAGDAGVIGDEDQTIVTAAIEEASKEKILAFGPFPSDGFFGSGQWNKFDAVLAMYHDQGLIPFKTLAFETGVNFTAGLPIVRVSPGHGTGMEIAGKGKANPDSFRNAIYFAVDILNNRQTYKEFSSNPLEFKKPKR